MLIYNYDLLWRVFGIGCLGLAANWRFGPFLRRFGIYRRKILAELVMLNGMSGRKIFRDRMRQVQPQQRQTVNGCYRQDVYHK